MAVPATIDCHSDSVASAFSEGIADAPMETVEYSWMNLRTHNFILGEVALPQSNVKLMMLYSFHPNSYARYGMR